MGYTAAAPRPPADRAVASKRLLALVAVVGLSTVLLLRGPGGGAPSAEKVWEGNFGLDFAAEASGNRAARPRAAPAAPARLLANTGQQGGHAFPARPSPMFHHVSDPIIRPSAPARAAATTPPPVVEADGGFEAAAPATPGVAQGRDSKGFTYDVVGKPWVPPASWGPGGQVGNASYVPPAPMDDTEMALAEEMKQMLQTAGAFLEEGASRKAHITATVAPPTMGPPAMNLSAAVETSPPAMNLTAPTTAPPAMGPPAVLAESQKALPAMGPPQMHIQFRPQRQQQQPQRALFVPAVDVNPAGVNFAAEAGGAHAAGSAVGSALLAGSMADKIKMLAARLVGTTAPPTAVQAAAAPAVQPMGAQPPQTLPAPQVPLEVRMSPPARFSGGSYNNEVVDQDGAVYTSVYTAPNSALRPQSLGVQPVPADRWQPGSLAGMQAIPTGMTVQQKLKEAEAELAEVQVRSRSAQLNELQEQISQAERRVRLREAAVAEKEQAAVLNFAAAAPAARSQVTSAQSQVISAAAAAAAAPVAVDSSKRPDEPAAAAAVVGVIGRKAALAHAVVAAKEAAEEAAEADVKARTAVVEAEAEIVRTEKADEMSAWLSGTAGLSGKRLAAALVVCDQQMLEGVDDLRGLAVDGVGGLQELGFKKVIAKAIAKAMAAEASGPLKSDGPQSLESDGPQAAAAAPRVVAAGKAAAGPSDPAEPRMEDRMAPPPTVDPELIPQPEPEPEPEPAPAPVSASDCSAHLDKAACCLDAACGFAAVCADTAAMAGRAVASECAQTAAAAAVTAGPPAMGPPAMGPPAMGPSASMPSASKRVVGPTAEARLGGLYSAGAL